MAQPTKKMVVIIGGGAAGFFCAINLARLRPDLEVHILEKSQQVLSKVKVSGGGRCNVTHACFNPEELIENYPRGGKELLGPFHHFQPADTIQWFEDRGVELHTEDDGRMFPVTNSSQTIIDCFLREATKYHVHIHFGVQVESITSVDNAWKIDCKNQTFHAIAVMMATGSSQQAWSLLKQLGHTIIPPVPSLFTFHIRDKRIDGLMGVSIPHVQASLMNTDLITEGPLLITHWGLSGPAILKLSAWGADVLAKKQYRASIQINFCPTYDSASCIDYLRGMRNDHPKKKVVNDHFPTIPSRLWKQLCAFGNITENHNWADLSNIMIESFAEILTSSTFSINGKSTFKEEFVTCGGVALNEVNMRNMESRLHPNLYFGGEMLNIDAVTGGFNFQAAWTTGWLAARSIAGNQTS